MSSPVRHELRALFELAWPATVTQVGLMLTGVVDTMVAARIGTVQLAAAAYGHMWMWSTMSIGMGLVMGTDPMISQAHGRGDGEGAALALQRGIVVAVLISVPISLAVMLTGHTLRALGEPAEVVALAARYNLLRVPMVPCFLVWNALRLFLQARGRMGSATALVYVANVLNALAAWALTFGRWGAPRLGLDGAALAGSLTSVFELVGLLALMQWLELAQGAQRAWDRASFSLAGIVAVLRIGGPIGAQFWLEGFAFTVASFMAGWISVNAIGAHQIAINLASLSFMLPLGVSMGASARVGNLIGANDAPGMRRAVAVALVSGIGVMSFSALAFTFLRGALPRLYTEDAAVIATAAQILPLAGAFQLSDGAQVVASGVLRGMGRPHAAAFANLIGYYALGLPLCYAFAFRLELGLRGIWIGLTVGLLVVSAGLLFWVRRTTRRPLSELSVGLS